MFRVIYIDGVKTNYAINEEGTVININTGCALHPNELDRLHRYRRVHLTINGESCFYSVHRLVMETFRPISNPNEMQVNHIDGDRNNNSLSNLEWVTVKENVKHAFRLGLRIPMRGELNGRSVLTESIVREICEKLCEGRTERSLAKEYGVAHSHIHSIREGHLWGHISKEYKFPRRLYANCKLFEDDLEPICMLILEGYSCEWIANLFGVSERLIENIKNQKICANITRVYLEEENE